MRMRTRRRGKRLRGSVVGSFEDEGTLRSTEPIGFSQRSGPRARFHGANDGAVFDARPYRRWRIHAVKTDQTHQAIMKAALAEYRKRASRKQGAIKQRHQIRHRNRSELRRYLWPQGEGWKQERGCQVEHGPVGRNLGLPKARLFALSIGRNLRKPYLSPSDCRNRIPPGARWGDMKCHG